MIRSPPYVPGYHLWLVIMYSIPFIPLAFIYGVKGWLLMLLLGLYTSLINDLFHYLVGVLIFGRDIDLIDSYSFQFGLQGFKIGWLADLYFIEIPVSSLSMGTSIYLRLIVMYL